MNKNFAIITNVNDKFLNELEEKLHFKGDKRIKFVGTVYDQELLKKIRENAYKKLLSVYKRRLKMRRQYFKGGKVRKVIQYLKNLDIFWYVFRYNKMM